MNFEAPTLDLPLRPVPAPLPLWRATVDAQQWSVAALEVALGGGRLVALWGSTGPRICAAYAVLQGLVCVELPLDAAAPAYPDLSGVFWCATRMQRAAADLSGLRAQDAADQRPWLSHGLWGGARPLADANLPAPDPTQIPADYPFVRVEGDGVHEIAVGPVHAGIIEPGHFRFSVVGEKVLRLEQHLGYTHKGVERRFTELPALQAYQLAGRISGDSTVAYAWAYCMALESACGCTVPERAAWLRALLLERERVANHLGDLGALGNDAALAFGLAQFSRLREDWQRQSGALWGHRLLMDQIVPGGVAHDLTEEALRQVEAQCAQLEDALRTLRQIYDAHAGLQDRFLTTGRVAPELAARLGLTGMAGRASAQAQDLRCDQPWYPYSALAPTLCTQRNGDVAARVNQRFDEALESLRLLRRLCLEAPAGPVQGALQLPQQAEAFGLGWVEGWRGEILVALELGANGAIARCHCHDPSWQNWPVLEHAIMGNIVADFPLINKSFNLSYSGHDL